MAAHYTVIQYVPDPVTDERINVGIAAFSEGLVQTRFLVNWQRVRAIGGKQAVDLSHLEAIFRGIDEHGLREMIGNWKNSIQFTEPGISLSSLEETIDRAAKRFLVDPSLAVKAVRTHGDVVSFARQSLLAAVGRRFRAQEARNLVRRNLEVPGRFGINRRFDLGVRNGKPIHAVQALSFEGQNSAERRVEAVAFLAEEIKGKLPLTVVVAPPSTAGTVYENAKRTLAALDARVVTEEEFETVADDIGKQAFEHVAHGG